MTKKDIVLGAVYKTKVSGQVAVVKIIQESPYGGWNALYGGWNALNLATGRVVRISREEAMEALSAHNIGDGIESQDNG